MRISSGFLVKTVIFSVFLGLFVPSSAQATVSKRLYFTDGTVIKYLDLGTGVETTVSSTNCSGSTATTDIFEIEVDSQNGILYFSRNSNPRTIVKLDTNSGSCTVIVTDTSPSQELFGFALDDSATHLYYNHYSENVIYKKNISTGVVTTVISGQIGGQNVVSSLKDIEIIGNTLYWTGDGGGSATKLIWSADLSASPIVPTNLYSQTGASSQMLQLGIDTRNSRLFYPQNYVSLSGASISRSNGNGSSPGSAIWTDDGGLISLISQTLTGFTINNDDHVAYWNQFGDGKIRKADVNLDGTLGSVSIINSISGYAYLTYATFNAGGGSSGETEAERNARLDAERRENERKRALVIQNNRNLILEKVKNKIPLTSLEVQEAALASKVINNIQYINSSLSSLPINERNDLTVATKIIKRVELLENFAEGAVISGRELVNAEVIEFNSKFKEQVVFQIRKLPIAQRNSIEAILIKAREFNRVAEERLSRVEALRARQD